MIPSWTPTSTNAEHAAREVIASAMWMHSTFKDEVWLWRGQARKSWGIQPSIHTRVLGAPVHSLRTNDSIGGATNKLIAAARQLGVDQSGGVRLPDLALLAQLQHHGAATPLLDVTTDPLIALWMLAFASVDEPDSHDDESGALIGILKPPPSRHLSSLDARPFWSSQPTDIASSIGDVVHWYEAPYVTERLRIQRGSFLIGQMSDPTSKACTIPLHTGSCRDWAAKRLENRGKASNTYVRKGDVFRIVVRGSVKRYLRRLLEERSGLSASAVFPSLADAPLIEQFAQAYGRTRPLSHDISDQADIDTYRDVPVSYFPSYQGPPVDPASSHDLYRME